MESVAMIENLLLFGLSRQEAILYLCLLKNGELTGYETAKITGISRSNVYSGLASLVEHGAAYIMEGNAVKYIAVSLEEFCENRIYHLKQVKKVLMNNMPKEKEFTEGYITIEGYQYISDKIYHMLWNAKERIYFSAPSEFLLSWKEIIEQLREKSIKVVLITDNNIRDVFKKEVVIYEKKKIQFDDAAKVYSKAGEEETIPIRLIIDSAYVLTGNINKTSLDSCLYSAQKNFVNVFKEAMRNEIKLIELGQ